MPYFDHNATTPLAPAAREAWLRGVDENWHNPSSPYRDAAKAKIRLDNARERIAEFIGVDPKQIVFTSGATESAHAVFRFLGKTLPVDKPLLLNPTEHPCVREAAAEHFAGRLVVAPLDTHGRVSLADIAPRVRAREFAAVVVMAAHNETGVIQPWGQLAKFCRDAAVPYVCDASQWLGKLPASGLGSADWVIAAAHKFGGPKGVGFLKIAEGASGFTSQPGGGQESGHRGGTENIASIWAMAAALAEAEQKKVFLESERLLWRQEFERELVASLAGTEIVAAGAERLWNTVLAVMPHGENHRWVTKLDKLGFQLSTGSACATGKEGASHVLTRLGYSPDQAKRVVRISAGWETQRSDWHALLEAMKTVSSELAATSNDVVKL
jgi:cysteine desulfurase